MYPKGILCESHVCVLHESYACVPHVSHEYPMYAYPMYSKGIQCESHVSHVYHHMGLFCKFNIWFSYDQSILAEMFCSCESHMGSIGDGYQGLAVTVILIEI